MTVFPRFPIRTTSVTLFVAALLLSIATPAAATWSVVAVDTETMEVGVASATCVTGIDLKAFSPAIVVARGAGAAQSQVDGSGQRRQIMRTGFLGGTSSDDIMAQLEALGGSGFHQNGVATRLGDAATFSGTTTFDHSSGLTGSDGSLHYAIQGNILTGRPVVEMAETAFLAEPGDLPAKLMAAMEASRAMGGDGRCSCPGGVTTCGSPPASFQKSADVGFVVLARFGDTDDPSCDAGGCADGDYFLSLNVANQASGDPDPVIQLQGLFDNWRSDLEDRPDAVASTASFRADGANQVLRIEVLDWRGQAVTTGISGVTVAHAPGSAGAAAIGAVTNVGGNVYEAPLTGGGPGDIFLVTIDDGVRPVVLPTTRTAFPDSEIFADDFEGGDTTRW
ncbi:MAG: DUF1028 domain-containing protein [Acidobacteriota bacterium]